jgi:hypothetical protein
MLARQVGERVASASRGVSPPGQARHNRCRVLAGTCWVAANTGEPSERHGRSRRSRTGPRTRVPMAHLPPRADLECHWRTGLIPSVCAWLDRTWGAAARGARREACCLATAAPIAAGDEEVLAAGARRRMAQNRPRGSLVSGRSAVLRPCSPPQRLASGRHAVSTQARSSPTWSRLRPRPCPRSVVDGVPAGCVRR